MIKIKNICIITDFDHTITTHDSKSSWDVLEMVKSLSDELREECQNNRNYYLPKEKDYKISFYKKSKYMKEWLEKNLNVFVKSKITEDEIKGVSKNKNCMKLRKDTNDLFKYAYKNKIPIIIISAGIEDIIKNFLLENKLLTENVYIISNKLKFKSKIISGIKNKPFHSLNKSKVKYPHKIKEIIKEKDKIFLLGDNIEDTLVTLKGKEKSTVKIGFLNKEKNREEYQKSFDVVLKNGTFKEVLNILKELS